MKTKFFKNDPWRVPQAKTRRFTSEQNGLIYIPISGVARGRAIGQLPASLKGIAQAFFEMLSIARTDAQPAEPLGLGRLELLLN